MSLPPPTSHGTRRRLQALASRGWSPQALQDATGIPATGITGIAALTSGEAHAGPGLSRRVAAAYNQLWDQSPPAATPPDQRLATAARTNAERHRWPPPLGWDDDEIDQPAARPAPGWKPGRGTSHRAVDLVEDMTFIQENGGYRQEPLGVIAERLGVTRAVLDRARHRAAHYHARAAGTPGQRDHGARQEPERAGPARQDNSTRQPPARDAAASPATSRNTQPAPPGQAPSRPGPPATRSLHAVPDPEPSPPRPTWPARAGDRSGGTATSTWLAHALRDRASRAARMTWQADAEPEAGA